ncbi:MAG TPA: FkbM family methyltransferase [Beijerinckiaceae bacterium]|nr:FkbM family methyltransferase [Beijerinckiaceae bacterium]
MSLFQVAKRFYRSHAYMYPGLFSYQQREMAAIRSQLNIVHDSDFRVLSMLRLPDVPLVIDIGANLGQSIGSIKAVLGRSLIKAFEPNPASFQKLSELYNADENVELFHCAIGNDVGVIELAVPECGGISFHQLANISTTNEDAISDFLEREGFTWAKRHRVTFRKEAVEIATLDSFGFEPHIIKIDVEGAEYDVICGGLATIERCKPALLVESGERSEIVSLLRDRGYGRYLYREDAIVPAGADAALNSIFLTDDHLQTLRRNKETEEAAIASE